MGMYQFNRLLQKCANLQISGMSEDIYGKYNELLPYDTVET